MQLYTQGSAKFSPDYTRLNFSSQIDSEEEQID